MPNHASSKKALRVSKRKQTINTRAKDAFKEVKKEIKKDLTVGSIKEAKEKLNVAYAKVDAAVKKTVIHKNTGSRLKSRMAAMIKKADQSSSK